MQWPEVDFKAGVWTVPGERMKAGEPHVVYLAPRACEILEEMRGLDVRYVFASPQRENAPMSNMAMLELLKQMGLSGQTTVHGVCRTCFSTWSNEAGRYRSDVIEVLPRAPGGRPRPRGLQPRAVRRRAQAAPQRLERLCRRREGSACVEPRCGPAQENRTMTPDLAPGHSSEREAGPPDAINARRPLTMQPDLEATWLTQKVPLPRDPPGIAYP